MESLATRRVTHSISHSSSSSSSSSSRRFLRLLLGQHPRLQQYPRQYSILSRSFNIYDSTTMTTTVQLATVPSADTPSTCIYLHHDKRSYVFGRVAEGTQRAFGSRKISMGGTEHVFLSGGVGWDQLSGLFGYLLTVGGALEAARKESAAAEERKKTKSGNGNGNGNGKSGQSKNENGNGNGRKHAGIGVHGADNLCHVLAACRPIIFRQPIRMRTFEHRGDPRAEDPSSAEPDWADDAIKVWKVPVRRARSSSPRKRGSTDDHDYESGATERETERETDTFKPRAGISDPGVAASVVERIMFSGSLKTPAVLTPIAVDQLQPSDVAVVVEDGVLKRYEGPFATDPVDGQTTQTTQTTQTIQTIPNAKRTAWLFPREGEETGKDRDEVIKTLAINHHPLPATTYGETSMSYIVKCHSRRGKFNAPVANSLGVKRDDFKLLAAGHTVQGADGPVTPEMVLGEPQPGRGIIVADIAGPDLVDAFLARPEWTNPEIMANVAVMYWILGPGIAGDARVQRFMAERERQAIKHILCAGDTCPNMITHPGPAEIQAKLRRIDPDRFPLLKFDNTVSPSSSSSIPSMSSVELGRAGHKLQLMPRLVYDDAAIAPFPDLVEAYDSVDDEILALASSARARSSDPAFLAHIASSEKDIPSRDAEIIPLGTGSSVPSKYRNVSSTLVRVPGIGNYLLDCGEGTLGQLRRLFGDDETASVLRRLRCIVISHVHADHHLGAPSVIKAWYAQSLLDGSHGALLAVSCIDRYRTLLSEVAQTEDIGFHRLRFPSCSPSSGGPDRDLTTSQMLSDDDPDENFGLSRIKRILVPHCWRSYATELQLTSGLRIAYSGDCRPSRAFAQACKGAHLLVHECTFGDDKADHARAKRHCTMGEALGVAREMGARRTLLTHFSQRYSKEDSLRGDEGDQGSVLLANDFMRVRLGEFQTAALFIPAVQKLMEKMGD